MPYSVAFQGERGAFSEVAITQWRPDADPVPYREFADVTRAVQAREVDAGVLPVENTTIGPIHAACAALAAADVRVLAELVVPIRPQLLAHPGTVFADVRTVSSHPAALAQCTAFLARHPAWQVIASYDTAGAARDLATTPDANTRRTHAVIASAAAARRYALSTLQTDVADRADNATRFVVIGAPA